MLGTLRVREESSVLLTGLFSLLELNKACSDGVIPLIFSLRDFRSKAALFLNFESYCEMPI